MASNKHPLDNEATPDEMEKDPALITFGIRNIRYPIPEKDTFIIDATNEASERIGLTSHPRLFIHEGKTHAIAYIAKYDCMLVPQDITNILAGDELKVQIAHELGHKKQQPIPDQIQKMRDHFNEKGRFNDLSFVRRYGDSLYKLNCKMELDADNTAIAVYGAENMKNALVNLLTDYIIHTDVRPEDLSSGAVTVDMIKQALEEVVNGTRTTEDRGTNLRLQNLGKQITR